MSKRTKQSRLDAYKDLLPLMRQEFPKAFPPKGQPPPLKIGVHDDLASLLDGKASRSGIRAFLCIWTGSPGYLRRLVAGGERVAPDGSPDGQVTKEQADLASSALKTLVSASRARRKIREPEHKPRRAAPVIEFVKPRQPAPVRFARSVAQQ